METGNQKIESAAEGFIDRREVSRRLQTSVRTVDQWMRVGTLPYYKVGNCVRFKWSEIERHFGQHFRVCRPTPKEP